MMRLKLMMAAAALLMNVGSRANPVVSHTQHIF